MNPSPRPLRFLAPLALAALLPASLPAGRPRAARALIQEAARAGSLSRSTALLRRALRLGWGSESGAEAALELAKLDYTAGRFQPALVVLRRARTWPRPGDLRPAWLYWSGQTRLALKQWRPAGTDFRRLLDGWPGDPNADAARLGEADALAARRHDGGAESLYQGLLDSHSAFSAQALWGLGTLAQDQGRSAEATIAFQRLMRDYPASFEAQAVPGGSLRSATAGNGPGAAAAPGSELAPATGPYGGLGSAPAPAGAPNGEPAAAVAFPGRQGTWSVQVGAFSRIRWARDLVRQLQRRRYRVQVLRREILGRWLYLVQVGPYPDAARASAVAGILSTRDKLPFKLVQE